MKAKKLFASALTTVAVFSAIGFAYAQTNSSDPSTNNDAGTTNQSAPVNSMDNSTTSTERAAQTDRN